MSQWTRSHLPRPCRSVGGLARPRARGAFRAPAFIAFSRGAPSPLIARRRPGPAPCPDATWPIISAGTSKRPTFTAKAIANYGRDCALPKSGSSPLPRAPGDGREPLACAPSRRAATKRRRTGTEPSSPTRSIEMWGTDYEPDRHHRGRAGLMFSSPSNTRTQKSSAFTPRVQPIASRRWSRSGRGCIGCFYPSRPAWRVGSSCVTTMAPITCPAISRARSKCLGHLSFAVLRARTRGAMASPSASSEP